MRFRGSTILIVAFGLVGLGLEWLKPDDAPVLRKSLPNWQDTTTGSRLRARAVAPPFLQPRRARPSNPFLPSAQAAPLAPKSAAKKGEEKKKKTKKKAKRAPPAAQAPLTLPRAPGDVETPEASTGFTGAGLALPTESAELSDAERDLQDWRDYLLNEPSHAKTLQLIEAFRAGQLSAEIFYTLVDEMLTQPAQQTRYFGVIALQATPSSESFQLLEAHYPTEISGVTKGLMQATRNEYAEVEKLPILSAVIASADSTMALIAISRARSALEKLPQGATTTPVASRNPRQPRPVRAIATGSLSGLQVTLTTVVSRERNTALGREASSLLEMLKRLQNTQSQT